MATTKVEEPGKNSKKQNSKKSKNKKKKEEPVNVNADADDASSEFENLDESFEVPPKNTKNSK
jgi:hypothetical protein